MASGHRSSQTLQGGDTGGPWSGTFQINQKQEHAGVKMSTNVLEQLGIKFFGERCPSIPLLSFLKIAHMFGSSGCGLCRNGLLSPQGYSHSGPARDPSGQSLEAACRKDSQCGKGHTAESTTVQMGQWAVPSHSGSLERLRLLHSALGTDGGTFEQLPAVIWGTKRDQVQVGIRIQKVCAYSSVHKSVLCSL